jgi:hypothetical protein
MKNLGISITLFNPVENNEQPHLWGVQTVIDPNFAQFEHGELTEKLQKELDSAMIDFFAEFPGIEGPIEPKTKMKMFRKSLEKVIDVISMLQLQQDS